ncbi:hypothetical protein [Neobacillus sp. LXY-1]|uniref:hypothetical protein n=1 Tax=Neobacillus sp. LXY-1 TaxID=3379133 RepID=UPI003EE35F5A
MIISTSLIDSGVLFCILAFDALNEKEYDRHDFSQMINKLIREHDIDVVILAQLSMARATNRMQNIEIPVLTSPEISPKAIVDKVLKKGTGSIIGEKIRD